MLEEETEYLQYGQYTESEYFQYFMGFPQASSWNTFPTTENPSSRYKYISVELNMSLESQIYSRQTYSLLDYLGDLGGLADALLKLGALIVAPFATFGL